MFFKSFMPNVAAGIVATGVIVGSLNAQIPIPARPVPSPATVAVIKTTNATVDQTVINQMVTDAINGALGTGGITNLVKPGNTVLIKPNLVLNSASAANPRVATDWRVVRALVNEINKTSPGRIIIAEGSAMNNTGSCMTDRGYTRTNFPEVAEVDFLDLNSAPRTTYSFDDGLTGENKQIASIIKAVNVYITVPVMKTHTSCGLTGAIKNIGVGIPPQPLWPLDVGGGTFVKGLLHRKLRAEIIDHVQIRVPDFALMDAISAMEGEGPASGTQVDLKAVLASRDPVAVDAVASQIMGIPPDLITNTVLAANENIGVMDPTKITVTGNTIAQVYQRDFVRAKAANPMGQEPGNCPYRATTVIRPAPAMVIDGSLNEWGYANRIAADTVLQVKTPVNNYGGRADCSFNAKFMYDVNNLYMAIAVRDDKMLVNSYTGVDIPKGECVELYLSTNPVQFNTTRNVYDPNYDYCLGFSYSFSSIHMLYPNRLLSGVEIAKNTVADGFVMEIKIPWSNFSNFQITRYRELGINVAVLDWDDNAAMHNKVMWSNAKESDIELVPYKMGLAYLDPAAGIYETQVPVLTSVRVTPSNVTIMPSATQQFTATGVDQYGWPFLPQPTITWSTNGGGAINGTTGLYTAGTVAGGPFTVTAQAQGGTPYNTATVTIGQPGQEKIINGTFNTNLTPWTNYLGAGGAATFAWFDDDPSAAVNGTVKMTITNGGTTDYAVQFNQAVAYISGKTYSLSFDAYSPEGNRTLVVKQEQSSGDYHKIGGSAFQTFAITTVKKNYTYSFKCTETNAGCRLGFNCGLSAFDVIIDNVSLIESSDPISPPTAPTMSGAIPTNNSIGLSWIDIATNETGYKVYVNTADAKPATPTATLAVNSNNYTITGLTASTRYYYWVSAYNAGGEGTASGSVSTTGGGTAPTPPSWYRIFPYSNSISFNWVDNATNEDSYKLYVNTVDVKPVTPTVTLPANTSSYTLTGLAPNTRYYYWLCAYNAYGEGCANGNVSTTGGGTAPVAPTGLTKNPTTTTITVSWTDVATDEDGYKVYISTTNSKPATPTSSLIANSNGYTFTGLTPATLYYFWACAYNAYGEGCANDNCLTSTPPGPEKIINGTFNTNLTPWTNYLGAGGAATFAWFDDDPSAAVNGTVKMTITNGGTTDYAVQFNQTVAYITGKTYSLSFDAYSPEGNRTIVVKQEQSSGDFHKVGGSAFQTFALTTAKKNYTYSFKSTETNTGCRLGFNCGLSAFDVIIDNVSLIETSDPVTAPTPPSWYRIFPSSNSITFNWNDNSSNEDGFKLYINTVDVKPAAPIVTLPANSSTTTVTGLLPSTHYYYWLCAYNVAGENCINGNIFTTDIGTAPAAPTGLNRYPAATTIGLIWTDAATNEDGYKVYVGLTATKPATPTATLSANTNSYTITGLNPNTWYYFWVCAYNAAGEGCANGNCLTDVQPGVEKIINGTFNTNLTPWTNYIGAGGAATIAWFDDDPNAAINGTVKMTITNGGTTDYAVQFNQTVAYTNGKIYSLSFDAYSPEGNRTIVVKQEQSSGDYHKVGGSAFQTFALTTVKQNFTYTFTSTETNGGCRLGFNCGLSAYDVIIDNVSLIEK
jgi:uncharacterized protein (DUF362 family)